MCLREFCFPDCWKVSSVVHVFINVEKRSIAKICGPFSLFSMVSKVFEKLVNDRLVDHLGKCGLFSDYWYRFQSSRSIADLLTVVSDKIGRAFNKSGATRAVVLGVSKALDRVWLAVLFYKLELKKLQVGFISSFLSNRLLRVVLDSMCLQKWLQWFFKAPFLALHFSCSH